MDSSDRNFGRVYKMIADVCRDILWENLIQTLQPSKTIIGCVQDVVNDPKTPKDIKKRFKEMLLSWQQINTTTPIESDFDITSLICIINNAWKKQDPHIKNSLEFIRKKRNEFVHSQSSVPDEKYIEDYRDIRIHVDILEQNIYKNYQSTVKWQRKHGTRYLSLIDRIHKEHIDPDNIKNLIKEWRKDIKAYPNSNGCFHDDVDEVKDLQENRLNIQSNASPTDLINTTEEIEYDKQSIEDTVEMIEEIIILADENQDNLKSKIKNQEAKIIELEEMKINNKTTTLRETGESMENEKQNDRIMINKTSGNYKSYPRDPNENKTGTLKERIKTILDTRDKKLTKAEKDLMDDIKCYERKSDERIKSEQTRRILEIRLVEDDIQMDAKKLDQSLEIDITECGTKRDDELKTNQLECETKKDRVRNNTLVGTDNNDQEINEINASYKTQEKFIWDNYNKQVHDLQKTHKEQIEYLKSRKMKEISEIEKQCEFEKSLIQQELVQFKSRRRSEFTEYVDNIWRESDSEIKKIENSDSEKITASTSSCLLQ